MVMQVLGTILVCFVSCSIANVTATRQLWALSLDKLAELNDVVWAWEFLFVFEAVLDKLSGIGGAVGTWELLLAFAAESFFSSCLYLVRDVVLWQFHLRGKR
jgi:hypothetical protein